TRRAWTQIAQGLAGHHSSLCRRCRRGCRARRPGGRQNQDARDRNVLGRSLRPDRGSIWASLVDRYACSRRSASRHAKGDAEHVHSAKSDAARVNKSGRCTASGKRFEVRSAMTNRITTNRIMTSRIMTWAAVAWIALWLTPYLYAVNDLITWR